MVVREHNNLERPEKKEIGISEYELTVKNKSSTLSEEITISLFDFSKDWKRDNGDLQKLEEKAFGENLQSSSGELRKFLVERSTIAVVARDAKGHVIGIAYGMAWPFVEKEPEDPKSEGGEKEAFEELPALMEKAIGRRTPGEKMFYVHDTAVLPEYQKQGIGSNMTKVLFDKAKERGFEVFVYHAMVNSGSSSMFKKSVGGTDVKIYENWYDTSDPTCLGMANLCDKQEFEGLRRLSIQPIAQTKGYNCGPFVLGLQLAQHGLNGVSMEEIEKIANTTQKYGTFPEDMVATVEKLGFKAEVKQNATLEDLMKKIDEEKPVVVICTLHYLPMPNPMEPPEKLWYAWQDTARHFASRSKILKKMLRPFEDVHYLLLVGYDKENLTFVDVAQGREKTMPKDEFEGRWFGKLGKEKPKILYNHWMMTVSS